MREFRTVADVCDTARGRAQLWGALVSTRDRGFCRYCGQSAFAGMSHHIVAFIVICRRVEAEARRDGVDLNSRLGLEELYRRIITDRIYRSLANGIRLCDVCAPAADNDRIRAEALQRLVPVDPDLPVFFDEPDADARITALVRGRPMRPWVQKTRRRGPVRVPARVMASFRQAEGRDSQS